MPGITETENWDNEVYQLETTDPVQGGTDGVDNIPHKALANRTVWLKAQVALKALLGGSATQKFLVATATLADEAVNKAQMDTAIAGVGGKVLQQVHFTTGTRASGTATFPNDDTPPQITEGTEFLSVAITPKSLTSILKIEVSFNMAMSSATTWLGGVFCDNATDALDVMIKNSTYGERQNLIGYVSPASLNLLNCSFRAGGLSATTVYLNGTEVFYAGTRKSTITVTEYEV